MFAGYDVHNGFQLYQTDPSGNYSGWKATVIGQNNQAGKSLLKTDYNTEKNAGDVPDTINLALKILLKTMDSSTPSSNRMELTVMKKNNETVFYETLKDDEVQKYLDVIIAEEEDKKKKETSTSSDI